MCLLSINAGLIGECFVQLPLSHAQLSCPHTVYCSGDLGCQMATWSRGPTQKKRLFNVLMEAVLAFCCSIQLSTCSRRVRGSSSICSDCVQHCLFFALF